MLLADLVSTSGIVASTRSRLAKVDTISACIRRASPGEIGIVVSYLSGELLQRRTGVGWAALRDAPSPAASPTLEVTEVDRALARVAATSGPGSITARRDELSGLLSRATEDEQRFLVMLVGGELRQGALAGIMVDAVARAADVEVAAVRRAAMLGGDLPAVAEAALADGGAGLDRFRLEIGRPLQPMLAKTATSVKAAMETIGDIVAVDWKLDGVRIQVHRDGDEVAVFTRTLDPITTRVPEVVEAALALPVRSIVLDGEAIALRDDGRPRPFQVTASRAASRGGLDALRRDVPLSPFFFDVLHLDGDDLIDAPATQRQASAEDVVPGNLLVPRLMTGDVEEATAFFEDAVARGHEGVVVKSLDAPYEAGRRGGAWLKVKPVHTLDLVVIGAEWGHGRRKGWLSNLHLGARDPESGDLVMLGKTFKGLTDELLRWQTERLRELETRREGITVFVQPELVVEIAFDGIQSSPRYPAGIALRFARVVRYRPDKRPEEADTVETVRALHQAGL